MADARKERARRLVDLRAFSYTISCDALDIESIIMDTKLRFLSPGPAIGAGVLVVERGDQQQINDGILFAFRSHHKCSLGLWCNRKVFLMPHIEPAPIGQTDGKRLERLSTISLSQLLNGHFSNSENSLITIIAFKTGQVHRNKRKSPAVQYHRALLNLLSSGGPGPPYETAYGLRTIGKGVEYQSGDGHIRTL